MRRLSPWNTGLIAILMTMLTVACGPRELNSSTNSTDSNGTDSPSLLAASFLIIEDTNLAAAPFNCKCDPSDNGTDEQVCLEESESRNQVRDDAYSCLVATFENIEEPPAVVTEYVQCHDQVVELYDECLDGLGDDTCSEADLESADDCNNTLNLSLLACENIPDDADGEEVRHEWVVSIGKDSETIDCLDEI